METAPRHNRLGYFRLMGYLEGTTLLLLVFVGMPLKRMFDIPEFSATMGPIHGVVFLLYVHEVVTSWAARDIRAVQALTAFIGSMVPFGTFINNRYMLPHTN